MAFTHLDDVLIRSIDEDQGLKHLEEVLRVFLRAKLTLNLRKCYVLETNIDYLVFDITKERIRPGE